MSIILGVISGDRRQTSIHDLAGFVEMIKCTEDATNEALDHPDWYPSTLTKARRGKSLQAEGKRFRDDTEMFGSGTDEDELVTINDSRKGFRVIWLSHSTSLLQNSGLIASSRLQELGGRPGHDLNCYVTVLSGFP